VLIVTLALRQRHRAILLSPDYFSASMRGPLENKCLPFPIISVTGSVVLAVFTLLLVWLGIYPVL